jgi:hypothetical protein
MPALAIRVLLPAIAGLSVVSALLRRSDWMISKTIMLGATAGAIATLPLEVVRLIGFHYARQLAAPYGSAAPEPVLGFLPAEAKRLEARLRALRGRIDHDNPTAPASAGGVAVAGGQRVPLDSRGVAPCEMCRGVLHQLLEFFCHYQYDLSTQPRTQEEHARKGGFCPLHTWHYEQVASPRGICTAYPKLLNRVARRIRSLVANEPGTPAKDQGFMDNSCPACRVCRDTEDKLVRATTQRLQANPESSDALVMCLPHLELLLRHVDDVSVRKRLLMREATVIERTAEDMQRYAIKHDALRRHLLSKEENDAPLLALQLLTGHRNVNAVFKIRDIL